MGTVNEPEHLKIARKELGQAEKPGTDHNMRIVGYFDATHYKATADEVPWCSAFVCWCLEHAGIRSTRSAAARSFLEWGVALDEPEIGCVVVMKPASPDAGATGHVTFYVGKNTDGKLLCLGGNQANRVKVSAYDRDRVAGFRTFGDSVRQPEVPPKPASKQKRLRP